MENSMEVPQKIKKTNIIWSRSHFWVYIQRKWKKGSQSNIYTPMFIAALFTIAKIWKQPKCPSVDEWIKKVFVCKHTHTHTHRGILFIHKKEGNPAICGISEPWGHYAKWSKSDRERQILYDITYMWNLTKLNSQKQIVEWGLSGTESWGKWGDAGQKV